MSRTFTTAELDAMEGKRAFTTAELDAMELPTVFEHLKSASTEFKKWTETALPARSLKGMPISESAKESIVVRQAADPTDPEEMLRRARAALEEPAPYQRPKRLGTIKPIDPTIHVARAAAIGISPEDSWDNLLRDAQATPGPQEVRDEKVRDLLKIRISDEASKIQAVMQSPHDRQAWEEHAKEQSGHFLAKTATRLDRGIVNEIGGAYHLAEELARVATYGKSGGTFAETADMYSELLNRPDMQPVVENALDHYLGGMVESAPFLATSLLPGGAAKAFAWSPRIAGAIRAIGPIFNFANSYGIASNSIYHSPGLKNVPEDERRLKSAVGGLISAGFEVGGGSGEKYWKQGVIDAATKKLGKARYFGRKVLQGALTEAFAEEIPQEAIEMIFGEDVPLLENGQTDWGKVTGRLIDAGIIAAAMGGLVGSVTHGVETSKLPSWTEGQVVSVSTEAVAIPGRTYTEAGQRAGSEVGGENPWIKAEPSKTNKGRVLLVQFGSDLLTAGKEDPQAKVYFEKQRVARPDADARLGDTWEIPKWITEASFFVPGSDVYFVRNMDEAKQFLKSSGYEKIMFSALDANTSHIQELVKDYGGKAIIGGYVAGKEAFAGLPNAVWYDSMPDMAKGEGYEYKAGVNLSHFEGSTVRPRLCMSKGCKHTCAFCVVPKNLTETSSELINQQAEAFGSLDAKLVYLDDKTFGQARNHATLPDVYWKIKEKNPEFEGFIIQTTAAQFNRFSDEFLAASHIRYVEIGVESYNDPILKALHKPANETIIDQAAARARRLKINLVPNIIIGLPQETAETYARTLAWLEVNKDIISHINVYNLALYAGTELAESIGVKADVDLNENVVEKSFHADPQIHKDFAAAVYKFGESVLDKPPVSQTGLTADQEIAAKYGVEPGRVELLLRQAEGRYRELKANKDRKGRHEDQPMVPMEIADVEWTREPGRYWFIKGKTPTVFKQWWNSLSAAQRKATRITVKPIGLHGNWQVTMPGNTATHRVVTGEKAEMAFLSRHRNDIEAILSDITSPSPVTTLTIPTKAPLTRSRQQLLDMGHGIAQQLGMTEEERRLLMVELTGKNSMDEMDDGQKEQYVQYVEELLRERGETYEPQPSSFYEMLDTLQTKERPDRIEEAETVNESLQKLGQGMVRLDWDATRMDRFFRWLDLGQPNGWFTKTFWRSMTKANAAWHDAAAMDTRQFDDMMKTLGLDGGAMFRKVKINDHLELDTWDQAHVYMLWQNEYGRKQLAAVGWTEQDIVDIHKFWGGKDSKEAKFANYLFEWYQNYWPIIKRVGISVGIDEDTLVQEVLYAPIMFKDTDLENQVDLLSLFSDKLSQSAGTKPEQKFTIKRTGPRKGAKLELNAAVVFFNSVNRFNRFVHMAPTAYTISKMLNNKQFAEALDKATYGKGKELVSNWLKHAVRGHGDVVNNDVLKIVHALQHSATIYALGWNVPSVGRQAAGSLHAISADPLMQIEWPKATAQAMVGGFREMAQEATDKSYVVRHRMIDDLYKKKHKWTKRLMKIRYGRDVDLDAKSLSMIMSMDRRTVIVSWTALYRVGLKKGMSEPDAVAFADDWIGNTQEMSEAIYLPDIMRTGMMGTVYKLTAPFTNAINQEYNLYWHDNFDPIREKGLVKGAPTTAYRFLWNYFIPALVFGIIRRGRLPEDEGEVAVDLGTYLVAPLYIVGDWAISAVTDADKRAMLFESGFQSAAGTVRAAQRGDVRAIIKNAVRTASLLIGALHPKARGIVTAQTVRSAEAAYDLAFAEEGMKPPVKSLIYGEYTAEKYKKKEEEFRR